MRRMQTIPLATDFRDSSRQAAQVAIHLGWMFGSRATLLHVMDMVPDTVMPVHQRRDQAAPHMRELVAEMTQQKTVVDESAIEVGHPSQVILRKASEMDADLLLMGAGESMHSDRCMAGPNAMIVMEQATQPVLAVHPAGIPKFRRILCPVDHSVKS